MRFSKVGTLSTWWVFSTAMLSGLYRPQPATVATIWDAPYLQTHHTYFTMKIFCFTIIWLLLFGNSFAQIKQDEIVVIYTDSILNNFSSKPIGINMDYFMDDDNYLKPRISTAEALKKMGVKYLRYPGGNKSDFYFFSTPPYQKSRPTLARTGRDAVGGRYTTLNASCTDFKEDPLDFDEFMTLCKSIGAEPVIVVAADEYLKKYTAGSTWSTREQLITHAKEWVRYANIKKKYAIKYWMIGNESWHESNPNSSAGIYAQDVKDFSIAMKGVDPSIRIVPNGNSQAWWDTLFNIANGYFNAISISNYTVYNYTNGFKTYKDSLHNFVANVDIAKDAISKYIPAEKQKDFKIIVAEYGPFDWTNKWPHLNNMGLAMANFEITGQQLMEPKIDFSCFWNTRWINNATKNEAYDALDRNGNINAIGMSLYIWANNIGNCMIKTNSNNPLKTFASIDSASKKLFLYVINKSNNKEKIIASFVGLKKFTPLSYISLEGKSPEDTQPVLTESKTIDSDDTGISLNATSITVITYTFNN